MYVCYDIDKCVNVCIIFNALLSNESKTIKVINRTKTNIPTFLNYWCTCIYQTIIYW